MRNKMITGAIIAVVLLSAAVLFWYFSPSDVSIVSIEAPEELAIGDLSGLVINMQNNASEDVNVTINVKNAFVDEKGVSLKGSILWVEENFSWLQLNATEKPQKEVRLKPGSNRISAELGYQVAGTQKVEVEVYRQGKLADSRTIEINVLKPTVEVLLQSYEGINGTNEVHSVYGYLQLKGKGRASGVAVNVSVINELTNITVKTVTRGYSLRSEFDGFYAPSESLVTWEYRKTTYDPVTGARTSIDTQTYAPIVVIELAKDEPSAEKYVMSPIVVKGKIGDRYRVVVTARWVDQVVSSEMRIPSPPPTSGQVYPYGG
ncbi:MAG: hypothetical protein PHH85_09415 [Candidatus Methanoperedens sp.]|nr:hypothetical protein [Candidatus Methanoperedens sp.]